MILSYVFLILCAKEREREKNCIIDSAVTNNIQSISRKPKTDPFFNEN